MGAGNVPLIPLHKFFGLLRARPFLCPKEGKFASHQSIRKHACLTLWEAMVYRRL